jgi:hypothetical protein
MTYIALTPSFGLRHDLRARHTSTNETGLQPDEIETVDGAHVEAVTVGFMLKSLLQVAGTLAVGKSEMTTA